MLKYYILFWMTVCSSCYTAGAQDSPFGYGGIGARIGKADSTHYCRLISLMPGMPAAKAQIYEGSYILKIDYWGASHRTVEEVADHIRGDTGAEVSLILRTPAGVRQHFTLTRVFIPDTIDMQNKKLSIDSHFCSLFKSILADYPSNFIHIKGGPVSDKAFSVSSECRIEIPGAASTYIFNDLGRYNNSWRCIIKEKADSQEAFKIYRDLQNLFAECKMESFVWLADTVTDDNIYGWKTKISYYPATDVKEYKHLMIAAEIKTMQYDEGKYAVSLTIEEGDRQ